MTMAFVSAIAEYAATNSSKFDTKRNPDHLPKWTSFFKYIESKYGLFVKFSGGDSVAEPRGADRGHAPLSPNI
jgi:hypothetical protein